MLRFTITIIFLLTGFHLNSTSATINSKATIYEKVGQYLREQEWLTRQQQDESSNIYLQNSNKIGLGFNPVFGSPVCYSGTCQMEGFGHPVFKLKYESSSQGACTDKLIPNNVSLDCQPSATTSSNTEIIQTLKQLSESISKKIEMSVGASYNALSFSYTNSKETSYMVDNIVQKDMTVMYTSAQVSYVKLSMFELWMELSDAFKYVIDNLPCCDEDWETEKYIRDYVFRYYGYTFVSTLMLGGIAQQSIMMKRESIKHLESRNISIKNAAKAQFYVSFGVSVEDSQSNTQREEFLHEVQDSVHTKLGGDPSIMDINEWSKSIPPNPVIIKFGMQEIFDLLTKRRFPNDTQIQNKSKLIESMLKKYIKQPLYCYRNCTNAEHGTCEESGYFQFGMCKCNKNWTGIDCSVNISSTRELGDVLSGTLCGYDRSFLQLPCNGHRPWTGCPDGWILQTWHGADFTTCYKAATSKQSSSPPGGLCGLWNSGGKQSAQILCNTAVGGTCPLRSGYTVRTRISTYNNGLKQSTRFCYKSNSTYPDLPGTLCGIQWAQTNHGPACDGYSPGLSQCPTGYALQVWTLETGGRFHLCAKR